MKHPLPKPSRVIILALGLGLMVSLAPAQWIEDSVFVGVSSVYTIAYNPTADVVYGVGYHAFYVIDCATNQLVVSIPSGGYGLSVAYDSIDNKAYCSFSAYDSNLMVVDGTTHSRIRTLTLDRPDFLVWDPDHDRLYACQPDDNRVAVIDCRTDSLLTRIHVGVNPDLLYLNRPQHKLYVLNRMGNSVSIIDLNTLDVIRTISVDNQPYAGWYAPTAGKFYCGTDGADVCVIDGVGDTLRKVVSLSPGWVNDDGMGGSEARGLVLVGTYYDTVFVIDMTRDSLIRSFYSGGHVPSGLLYGAASDRFYCANSLDPTDNVAILAGDGSGVLRTLPVPKPVSLLAVPTHGRIYAGSMQSPFIYVLRDSATGICESGERREAQVLAAWPNPFRQAVTFSAPTGIAGPVRIWNTAGALVRTLPARFRADDWIWDGRDASGRAVAPGVYCATLDGARGAALKLVRLP
jgi:YVTN family beta-propeller protein